MDVLTDINKGVEVAKYLDQQNIKYRVEGFFDLINYTIAIHTIYLGEKEYEILNAIDKILDYQNGDSYFFYEEEDGTWYIIISREVFDKIKEYKKVRKNGN